MWPDWSRAPASPMCHCNNTHLGSGSRSGPRGFIANLQVVTPMATILKLHLKGKISRGSVLYNLWFGLLLISMKNSKRSYLVFGEFFFFFNNLSCALENWLNFFQSI